MKAFSISNVYRLMAVCVVLALFFAVSAQGSIRRVVVAALLPLPRLDIMPSDPKIRIERGGESVAVVLQASLDANVEFVASSFGRPFPAAVECIAYGSKESFSWHAAATREAVSSMFSARIAFSPRLLDRPERIDGAIRYELVQLYLRQSLGAWGYAAVPAWFQKGLGVYLAGGGMAEDVSEDEATNAIRAGLGFTPEKAGSLLGDGTGRAYGLTRNMFNRQSALFVGSLVAKRQDSLPRLMAALERGDSFSTAFFEVFGVSIDFAWTAFRNGIIER